MPKPPDLLTIARAIARRDPGVSRLLRASPDLARAVVPRGATRATAATYYLAEIEHPCAR